jgi:hypothetical protein
MLTIRMLAHPCVAHFRRADGMCRIYIAQQCADLPQQAGLPAVGGRSRAIRRIGYHSNECGEAARIPNYP